MTSNSNIITTSPTIPPTTQRQIYTSSATSTSSNVNAQQRIFLGRINTIRFNPMQNFRRPGLSTLPDPLGLMKTFVEVEWHNDVYSNMHIHGYPWYQLPPYLRLHLYHTNEIELSRVLVPSTNVLHNAYSMIKLVILI